MSVNIGGAAPARYSSRPVLALSLLLSLSACGGGGGGSRGNDAPPAPPPTANSSSYVKGVFMPSDTFVNQCAQPRPSTSDMQGSILRENNYLRSLTNELYLWYRDVPDLDPAPFTDTLSYFARLKTSAKTASGADQDRFHFTIPTAEFESFFGSGIQAGYGVQFFFRSATPPRDIVIAYTEPNSPAAAANLVRGNRLLAIDGVDAVNASSPAQIDALNAGLSPQSAGESHTFTFLDLNTGAQRQLTLTAANVTSVPVPTVRTLDTPSGRVGYLLFNDHIATAEAGLVDAIRTLKADKVTDLVLDVRYNGGGFLDIASELAYMIAGPMQTAGRPFERVVFNDKNPVTNPVTKEPLMPTPFYTRSLGFAPALLRENVPLPTLDLPQPRVFMLTTSATCSASESIINALRGVDVEVIQIGSTTCGKPYGFFPHSNCGTTYFTIEFQGLNAKNFGEYSDGFTPANAPRRMGVPVPGCSVFDDFNHPLGDPEEAMLAAALATRGGDACPAPSANFTIVGAPESRLGGNITSGNSGMLKSPERQNRLLRAAGWGR
jgi:carboxyl-terminal processing protease